MTRSGCFRIQGTELDTTRHLVSVITPTYNHEKFIAACIRSVLSQTFPNWEQIVIDDGSSDGTTDVVNTFSDPRIRLIQLSHRGVDALALTYNEALAQARGDLVAILEGDDLWPAEKLSKMLAAFKNNDVVLAHGEAVDVDIEGVTSKRVPRIYRQRAQLARRILFNDPIGSSTGYLLTQPGQSFITTATVVIRAGALRSIGGFQYIQGRCSPDIPTFVKLSTIGKFYYMPEILGLRRRHLGSATLQNLTTMPDSARKYAIQASLDPLFGLSKEQQQLVADSWGTASLRSAFTFGRIALLNRNWASARKEFRLAMRSRDVRFVAGAMIGWTVSWLHLNLEPLYRIAGRTPLRPLKT